MNFTLTTAEGVVNGLEQIGSVLKAINAPKIFSCVVLAVICLVVYKLLMHLVEKLLKNSRLEATLHSFVRTTVRVLLLFLIVLILASELGFDVTSLIALLSVVGLAVSLAVQNSLSNLAGGIQVLVSKPFKVGDFVDVGGVTGTVREVRLLHTRLCTPDNKIIYVPNADVAAARLTNFSSESTRRVDLTFGVSYESEPETVLAVLRGVAEEDPRVLQDPAPFVRLTAYKESTVEYTVRVWCAAADYWDIYFDALAKTKQRFDAAGVRMTYPHMNVHIEK